MQESACAIPRLGLGYVPTLAAVSGHTVSHPVRPEIVQNSNIRMTRSPWRAGMLLASDNTPLMLVGTDGDSSDQREALVGPERTLAKTVLAHLPPSSPCMKSEFLSQRWGRLTGAQEQAQRGWGVKVARNVPLSWRAAT